MDHKQVNVKWPMNALIPFFPLGTLLKTFFGFFPKNLLYWNRKFNEILLYICIFGVPGISFWGHMFVCLFH